MDTPRGPQQNAGPPPLPRKPEERGRHAAYFVVIAIASGILLLLLLAIWLGRSSESETSTAAKGNHSPTNAGTETVHSATKSNQGRESGRAPEDEQVPHNSAADVKVNAGTELAIDQEAASTINPPQAPELRAAQSDNATEELVQNGAEIEVKKQPSGNQFFTLGDAAERHQRAKQRSEQRDSKSSPTRDALTGRMGSGKEELLQAYGGSAATEAAVKLGLEWLARNQHENGSWSLSGPYSDASAMENTSAATAMALLAFQGAGHTHQGDRKEPFTRVVERGSKALLRYVSGKENATSAGDRFGGYAPALCTIAICELYGMTGDRKLRAPALQAVNYCTDAQSLQGGWRYIPQSDSDTSVTGWFLMGLQSARMAGLKVPNQVLDRVASYLDAAGNMDGSRYSYQPGLATTQSMSAEALLCRQYLGWRRDDPRLQQGVQFLLDHLPDWDSSQRDVYYWYYATQVCHHMGGDQWRRWNGITRELLPAKQVKEGPERGSWNPRGDRWGSQGGRLYVTCFSVYILEVYYRYLSLYESTEIR